MKILILTDYERYGGVATASAALQQVLSCADIEVERYPIHTAHRGVFGRLHSILKAATYLRSSTADKIILMHFEAILAGLLCRPFRSTGAFVNSVHTDLHGYYRDASFIKKICLHFIFSILKDDVLVFDSKEAAIKAKQHLGFSKTHSIYNVVALPQNVPPQANERSFRFGSVSRLHSGKNIDLLIRVFNSFWLTHKNTELLIFGDGPELGRLTDYAKTFPCSGAIIFKGYVGNPDEIYSQIDSLVGFSSMEGFGLVILEALVRNIPVLHSDCSCGPREILVPTSDPCHKTSSFEIGAGGMLVKIPEKVALYAHCLQDSEGVILEAFCLFYQEFDRIKKTSIIDMQKFGPDVIRKKWVDLLLC
jgi:glycosyltransferase involved in cell wall biosynthesis